MLGIGMVELIAVAIVATSALVMVGYGYLSMRWGLAAIGSALVGALITPADVYSMLVMTLILLCVYFAGTKHRPSVIRRLSA